MLGSGAGFRFGLGLLAALLALGLWQLFALRFESGEIYPPYSTLRTDPLGARVLSEAIAETEGLQMERNFLPLVKLHPAEPVTLIYAGIGHEATWEEGEPEAFATLVKSGSRAVFAFSPRAPEDGAASTKGQTGEQENAGPAESKAKAQARHLAEELAFAKVAKTWGLEFALAPGRPGAAFSRPARREVTAPAGESRLPWHSALYFANLTPDWQTLYRAEGRPVVIERRWGAGSIVLVSDAFLLSNEALHSAARAPQFLTWLLGPSRQIVFDEEHLGLAEHPGVAMLLRRYRLHGFFLALAGLAGLFLWQQALPFLPPAMPQPGETVLAGRGTSEGLRTLLRRSLPPGQLMETCLAEWRATAEPRQRVRVEQAWAVLPERDRRPLAAWPVLASAAQALPDRTRSA